MTTVLIAGEVFTLESGQTIAIGNQVENNQPQVPQALQDEMLGLMGSLGMTEDQTANWDIIQSKEVDELKEIITAAIDITSRVKDALLPNDLGWNYAKGLIKTLPYLTTKEQVLDVFDETFFQNTMFN